MDKNAEKFKVILATPTKGSIQRALKKLKDNQFAWAYFGEDVSKAVFIERQIQDKGTKLEIGKKLQETAKELRQSYIDYIGKLSAENNSLNWWASSVSEKNPFVSKTFLHACYIKTCKSFLNSRDQDCDFVFFIENDRLRNALTNNGSPPKGYEIKKVGMPVLDTLRGIREWAMMSLIKVWFIAESMNRMFLSKYFYTFKRLPRIHRGQNKNKGVTVIHTWIDNRSFDKNGKFHDSYLGELAHHLRERGEEVVIVPYVLSTLSYSTALKNMQKSGEKFLLPYAFLGIKEILSIALNAAFPVPGKKEVPPFEGMDLSELIYDDRRRDWTGIRLVRDLALYNVVRGWKKSGVTINSFIYPFENQTWEKVFNIALREFYPETKTIGYQHSVLSKMLLNYFYSPSESEIIPLPDKIITNGRYLERLFKESGYDPQKVFCGGAIRYANILKESKMSIEDNVTKTRQKFTILVTPSIERNEAAELVWKALGAFKDSEEYEVIIKCHPVMPYNKFARGLGVADLPKNFRLSQRPILELLKETSVLLYTSSTTSIEALAFGVPVIHVESDFLIDRDPLDFVPDFVISAHSPEEIVKHVNGLSMDHEKILSVKREKRQQLVGEVFGEVNDSVYDLFLNR